MRRILLRSLVVLVILAVAAFAAFKLSPWPSALLVRWSFDKGAVAAAEALGKHVPAGIVEQLDLAYDPADEDGRLDLFLPPNPGGGPLPLVVWVHGGAWISGDKSHVANYLRILAGRGFAAVGVNYSIAPGAKYPTPLLQVNRALAWLQANGEPLGLDTGRIVLAGDSAGAQIVGQLANIIVDPAYAADVGITPAIAAAQLRGLVLHCGAYDALMVDSEGDFGGFIRMVVWAYLGVRDFEDDPRVRQLSVLEHLSPALPPLFISAGNDDPLAPQSYRLAELAAERGLAVETLFYPADHQPPLGHEYQFNLDGADGRTALERSVAFIARVTRP